jgi:hypothetical protein
MKQETTENQQMAVTVLDDYSVIVSHDEELQGFFTDGKNLDALYGVIEAKAKGLVADPTTKEGASQIKGAARQLASVRIKVDNLGKQVVAELKKLPDVIDDNRKAFREKMLSKGNTRDAMELFKDFKGAEPSVTPLLKSRGLL